MSPPTRRRTTRCAALVKAGADPNALERDRYDIVTIAAVADDVPTLETALAVGCNRTQRHQPLRRHGADRRRASWPRRRCPCADRAGAPLDHVNNLGWTALIESIVLGDGGPRHVATMKALIDGGANVNLADRSGATPLALARSRGFAPMVALLAQAGAR